MAPTERRAPRDFDHTHGPAQTSPLLASPVEPPLEPIGGSIVSVSREDPWDVMDSWDQELVVSELRGEAPRGKLVYQFRQQGKDVVGLGKAGVDFACELLAHQGQVIRELDLTYVLKGEGEAQEAYFTAKAGRFALGTMNELPLETVIAVKRQGLYDRGRFNPFWFEHGAMKALRNARMRLLPLLLRETVMAMARADGRVDQDSGQRKTDAERAPATEDQRRLYGQMLASHHLSSDEREKAIAWLNAKPHSKESLTKAIDALTGLLTTRQEEETTRP